MKVPNLFPTNCCIFSFSGFSLRQILCRTLCTTLAVHACRHDAACIARTFSAREKSLNTNVLQGVLIPDDSHRRRCSRLYGYQRCLVCQESVGILSEDLESLLQTLGDHLRQPEVKRTGSLIRCAGAVCRIFPCSQQVRSSSS